MIAHPQFAEAARSLATNMLASAAGDEALGGVFKDAGRYVTALWVGYLHATGGMTLARLKELCAASGYLSPGRARSLLQFLQHVGYVAVITPPGAGARPRYEPTPLYFAAWRSHSAAALRAAAIVAPDVTGLIDRMEEAGVFETFLCVHAARLHDRARVSDAMSAFFQIFPNRYAGLLMVMTFVETGGPDDFPSAGEIPVSLSAAARRFGVSQIHIRRMLTDATRAGLLLYDAKGTVRLEEEARTAIRFFYASQLAELVASAQLTLARLADARPG